VPVRAQIRTIESLSAHADSSEILQWLRTFKSPPEQTFIVHGEPEGSEGLAAAIKKQLGWRTHIPEYLEAADLR
jgi:metallo-beta-lactamase family protein